MLDAAPSEQIAAVERLVNGNKAAALVLYCNGPYCQASRRLGEQLAAAGFTNVRRYQLGMPVWRALGGPTVIELNGILRIAKADRPLCSSTPGLPRTSRREAYRAPKT